ncbi:helix-turn-helix domain-containing protein [Variovorax sp. 160MFSha2.1]|uniref:helix-turn-helix domain-containing protein n=1 Tax=Variovorax sp. 160MFSha2.1 TaxID=3158367 RepID=UPI003AAC48A5
MKTKENQSLANGNRRAFTSVWDALSDTTDEAENMKIRSALMMSIRSYINAQKLTQAEAAKACQITQPRMNDLLNGKISKFSLDALINIATAAGLRIDLIVREPEPA